MPLISFFTTHSTCEGAQFNQITTYNHLVKYLMCWGQLKKKWFLYAKTKNICEITRQHTVMRLIFLKNIYHTTQARLK